MATSGSWNTSWQSLYWAQSYNTKYYHWTGNWSKSGNTITLYNMKLWMSFTYASSVTGSPATDSVTVTGGSAQTVTYPIFTNAYSTAQVSLNDTSFTVGSTATSYTLSCVISGEETGYITINFDRTYTAPTTPTVSAVVNSSSSITLTYGTTSFGYPASGTVQLYGGTSANPETVISTNNTTGDKVFTHTHLTPGTTYYYRVRVYNGQLWSNYSTEITATTNSVSLYGSLNNQTKRISKLYGSVNGQTKEIQKLYGSVNGVTKRIY